jgi:2-polyprenyl-3-methyl-5-hydroxy-6-metoxy-1,4-benzoquinol methylase
MRAFASRQLRDLPPGRRLRLRLALEAIEDRFGGEPNLRLLDAGSEEGLLCLELARRHPGWLLVAADITVRPLQRGLRLARTEGLQVSYLAWDLQRKLAESSFDAVAALESLVEIPDDQAAMATMAAALGPGGLFLVQVPTADWTPALRGAERTWRREARHGYEHGELVAGLEGLGLQVQKVTPTFRRTVALAQDVRDRLRPRGRYTQLALLPLMAAAVALERAGLTWGPPRALFVVAVKR